MTDLIRRAQAGDASAFEQLYRDNVNRVYALSLRMCADPVDADDLTQDVFVRAWRKLSTFRGDSAFSTWLHRLAVNVIIQSMRSRKRRLDRVMPVDDPAAFDTGREDAPVEPIADLERALRTLPPGARLVYLLHDVEGYRHEEIAEVTGTAVGTSKAQLHRARKLLRKVMER